MPTLKATNHASPARCAVTTIFQGDVQARLTATPRTTLQHRTSKSGQSFRLDLLQNVQNGRWLGASWEQETALGAHKFLVVGTTLARRSSRSEELLLVLSFDLKELVLIISDDYDEKFPFRVACAEPPNVIHQK